MNINKKDEMTSMQRVFTALSFKEPDRVPLFLALTLHGAQELELSIEDYFSNPENVAQAQLLMQKKYSNDFLLGFYYAPLEVEILGGEVIFRNDGPPNSGNPLLKDLKDIKDFEFPKIMEAKRLRDVLKTISILKDKSKGEIPIIGVSLSPFSSPVIQMGFDKYIELIYQNPEHFRILMEKNSNFCIEWSNAQLEAGATAICYFDPVSSTTITSRDKYIETGLVVAKNVIPKIKGPVITHFASGRCKRIMDLLPETKTAAIAVSVSEDLAEIKLLANKNFSICGNLNGIEMRRWTEKETDMKVKEAIIKGASGGGFVLTDNHGEIPIQVPKDTLTAISEAVKKWGTYPIKTDI